MQATRIHDAKFLTIRWDQITRIIGIEWKDTTAAMTDPEFKADLTLFADHVEQRKARGILVDVARFRHKMAPGVHEWRVRNISKPLCRRRCRAFCFPPSGRLTNTADDEPVGSGREVCDSRIH